MTIRSWVVLAGLLGLSWGNAGGGAGPQAAPQMSPQAAVQTPVQRRDFVLNFAGVPAKAQMTFIQGQPPAPLVLLIQGSGPGNMDGGISCHDLAQNAEWASDFATQGFVVMRFDKRYSAQTCDTSTRAGYIAYSKLSLRDLLADARVALNTALKQPEVNPQEVYLIGTSEGGILAANLTLESPAAGLVLQAPILDPWPQLHLKQLTRKLLPMLKVFGKDGKLTAANLWNAGARPLAPGDPDPFHQALSLFADPHSTAAHPLVNSQMDINGDGLIDLQTEAMPFIQRVEAERLATDPRYGQGRGLPTALELASQLKKIPILILQGTADSWVDPASALKLDAALAATGNQNHTLKVYQGEEHGFFTAQTAVTNDVALWLKKQHEQTTKSTALFK